MYIKFSIYLCGLFFLYNCSGIAIQSQVQQQNNKIDAKSTEWQNTHFTEIEELNALLAAQNNDSVLFLMLRFRSDDLARQLKRGGFVLWLSKDKNAGISYQRAPGNRRELSELKKMKPEFWTAGDSLPKVKLSQLEDFSASFYKENRFYSLEFEIPLQTFSYIRADDQNSLHIEFQTPFNKIKDSKNRRSFRGGFSKGQKNRQGQRRQRPHNSNEKISKNIEMTIKLAETL